MATFPVALVCMPASHALFPRSPVNIEHRDLPTHVSGSKHDSFFCELAKGESDEDQRMGNCRMTDNRRLLSSGARLVCF